MDRIQFSVNGVKCSVGSEVSSTTMLLDYLRGSLELRGTKYMCREGGCGACIVVAQIPSYDLPRAVNSCLVSITSCEDWEITTIEGIGNRLKGYHPIQKTLADHNGTQCGYCTPGWVMSMYGLLKSSKSDVTMLEIEKSFASNICRCTAYRPILDAFKTFGKDAPQPTVTDIEDLHDKCGKANCKKSCLDHDWCNLNAKDLYDDKERIKIELKDNRTWYKVYKLADVYEILNDIGDKSYMLVGGNTAKGAYPILEYPKILIDVSDVSEMKRVSFGQNLSIGSGLTLNQIQAIFRRYSKESNYQYLDKLASHLDLVASIPVRNVATVGGNLMTKHIHNDFPSDPFLLLETVGATVVIHDSSGKEEKLSPEDFLVINMEKKIIVSVELAQIKDDASLITYKIMPRAQNAVARVNAGFLYKLSQLTGKVSEVNIVFGGINPDFVHAKETEAYLNGKELFTNATLQEALKVLEKELIVREYPEHELKSRKKIALGLFYKALLTICPVDNLEPSYQSAVNKLPEERPTSKGRQMYDTNPDLWPLNEPMPKVEALIQCAGEAPYADDEPLMPGEVFAAFVVATVPTGEIDTIDYEGALKLEGVLAFYTAKDLPGKNSFIAKEYFFFIGDEEQFCDGKVKFHGQPIGVIVAETEHLAEKAAKLVKITYKNVLKPILTIEEAKTHLGRLLLVIVLPPTDKGLQVSKIIKGTNAIESQYHFHMEKQTCISKPTDDGMEVISSTQWIDATQIAVSQVLKVEQNCLDLKVRRIGGGFGAKISRSPQIAVACSLVTAKLNRPCRMVLPMTTNMKSIGKRLPCSSLFDVGVSKEGEIQYLRYTLFEDNGYTINEPFTLYGLGSVKNTYGRERWTYTAFDVITDTAKNSWCRSPGTLEAIAMIEYIMEQISYELSLDPIEVRLKNVPSTEEDNATRELISSLKKEADYDKRREEVNEFNKNNRWKKRGLRFACMKWPLPPLSAYVSSVSVNHGDGTVLITHGGIELGQGINTKAIQVCAYTLNIPMEKIRAKATNNITNPNSFTTGGSFTSENVCYSIIKSCQLLLERLEPLRSDNAKIEWEDLIKLAYEKGIDLFASYHNSSVTPTHYYIFGSCLSEVEVDILTGEIQILRVDLIEDVGQSLSPEIDVGQVEGAFVMGLGYWTTEKLYYDKSSGELLSDRTWNYHVPQARDIPRDFRVYFRRNAYNEVGVLGSKATGEPATTVAVCVPFAIREGLAASRSDTGYPSNEWFHIKGPYTLDEIVLAADTKLEEFLFRKNNS